MCKSQREKRLCKSVTSFQDHLLSFDAPNAEAWHVSAQFAYAKTNLCFDLAKAKKAMEGKKEGVPRDSAILLDLRL